MDGRSSSASSVDVCRLWPGDGEGERASSERWMRLQYLWNGQLQVTKTAPIKKKTHSSALA